MKSYGACGPSRRISTRPSQFAARSDRACSRSAWRVISVSSARWTASSSCVGSRTTLATQVRNHDFRQGPRVSIPLGHDRVADDRTQPDPPVPGGVRVFAPDLLGQPGRFRYLGAALGLLQRGLECLLIDREQFRGHSVSRRHDRAEPQRQHGHLDHGRIQDLCVRPQIIWCPPTPRTSPASSTSAGTMPYT